MMKKLRNSAGFTLVEVMAVVVILGIIAAIAIPSYQESMRKTRRVEAQSALLGFASAMERHYSIKSSYIGTDAGSDALGSIPDPAVFASEAPLDGGHKYYDLRMTHTTLSYTLYAFPKDSQNGDGALRLTSTNARGWDKSNDDSYSHPWQ